MSLRRTSYVAPKLQRGLKKAKRPIIKSHFLYGDTCTTLSVPALPGLCLCDAVRASVTTTLTLTIAGGSRCNRTRISVDQFHRFHVNIGSLGSTVVVDCSMSASKELAPFPVTYSTPRMSAATTTTP